jgi:hypothetical protein
MKNISNRIDIMNSQLPKQAMWRASILMEYKLESLGVDAMLAKLEQGLTLAESLPELVDEQRTVIMQEVDRQRAATIASLDDALDSTIGAIDREREETFSDLEAIMTDTFNRIEQERNSTVEDVSVLLAAMVKDAEINAETVVDYIFWRSLLLVGVGFVGGLILVVTLRVWKQPA